MCATICVSYAAECKKQARKSISIPIFHSPRFLREIFTTTSQNTISLVYGHHVTPVNFGEIAAADISMAALPAEDPLAQAFAALAPDAQALA